MSITVIRKALEKRLAAMTPQITTQWENVNIAPVTGAPYQRVNLLPAEPDNQVMGSAVYFERGIFQVTLAYPQAAGTHAAGERAQAVRDWFKRGSTIVQDGLTVLITHTPHIARATTEDDRYMIPVSIRFQAQVAA